MKASNRRSAGSILKKSGCIALPPLPGQRRVESCRSLLPRNGLSREKRWEIISAYIDSLEQMKGALALESQLPYDKDIIRLAILQEMVENSNADQKNLEIAYVQLESFLPYDEYRVIAQFKDASLRAQEMIESGNPTEIIRSASLMKEMEGDRAVRIQERISERIYQRMAEIQEIGVAGIGKTCVVGDAELICV